MSLLGSCGRLLSTSAVARRKAKLASSLGEGCPLIQERQVEKVCARKGGVPNPTFQLTRLYCHLIPLLIMQSLIWRRVSSLFESFEQYL
jgi:hypothetical protein